jgi:hypothetical protein
MRKNEMYLVARHWETEKQRTNFERRKGCGFLDEIIYRFELAVKWFMLEECKEVLILVNPLLLTAVFQAGQCTTGCVMHTGFADESVGLLADNIWH